MGDLVHPAGGRVNPGLCSDERSAPAAQSDPDEAPVGKASGAWAGVTNSATAHLGARALPDAEAA